MDTTGQRMKFEKAATAADQALGILDAYAPEKKSLLSSLEGKELIDRELEEKVQISGPELIKTARGIYDLDREYAELRAGIAKIENQIESLMPWMALDVPLQEGKTKRTALILGTMPGELTLENIYSILLEKTPEVMEKTGVDVHLVSAESNMICIAVICLKEQLQTVEEALRSAGFARPSQNWSKTPKEQKEVLDGATVSSWLHVDGFEVKLDTSQVENYVAALRKKYDTIFRSRTFMTSYGKEITIDGGDYGWWMNYDQEAKELEEMIENGESGERTPVYYQTAASYGTPDYGNTYVEINLTAQHLFFYQDGQLMMESDFVSGNSAKGYDTPAGVYSITYKQRDATLKGENYETPVSYWMPFNRNIGMHDASWRSDFGGTIYKTKGSHGCINMPPAKAQEMYGYVQKGTPVICYHLAGTERSSEQEKGAPSEGSEAADTSAETDTVQ